MPTRAHFYIFHYTYFNMHKNVKQNRLIVNHVVKEATSVTHSIISVDYIFKDDKSLSIDSVWNVEEKTKRTHKNEYLKIE